MNVSIEALKCTGKTRHETRDAASVELKRMKKRSKCFDTKLNVYKCDFCDGYHVGKRRGGIK